MFFRKTSLLLYLVVAASALVSPGTVHSPSHHRELAARLASPQPVPAAVVYEVYGVKPLRKRSRPCKALNSTNSSSSILSNTAVHTTFSAAPTSTKKAPPTTTQHVAPPSSSPISNEPVYLQGTNTGDATAYPIGMGACGIFNSGNDKIIAVSKLLFDTYPGYNGENPNDNPVCNRQVTTHYQGKTVQVTVTDRCENCALEDLDFSPAAFNELTGLTDTRVHGMTWTWD